MIYIRANKADTFIMNFTWVNKKWGIILLHIAVWLIVLSLPYLLLSNYNSNKPKNPDSNGFFYLNTLTGLFWVMLFYLNAYVLTPYYLNKKKYLLYITLLIGTFCFIMAVHTLLFNLLIKTVPFKLLNSLFFNLPTFLLVAAVSIIYQFMKDKAKTDKYNQQKHEENLKTELSFLRSQISPHFIFNVLNNMVSLVRLKSDQLEPTIMNLSSLMQYMVYETDEEKVLLKKEIEYLQSYIDLQRQRFGSKLKLNVTFDAPDDWFTIEPMLLIPFVENAFKHGIGLIQDPQIDIELHTKNEMLYFTVRNKFNAATPEIKDKTSGIGLANVKRRLNLLYGNNQQLIIKKEADWFSISLQLKLH